MRSLRLLVFLAFLPAASPLPAQPADWKAGLAAVEITPAEPIPMAGYASRLAPFEAVEESLFAKALALEDRDGSRALLITVDLIGFTAEVAALICRRLEQSDGLAREDILLNASHTHSGPLVSGSVLTMIGPEQRTRIEAYVSALEDKIVAAGQKALRDLRPAKMAWGSGVVNFVMNRREFTARGVILGVNGRGPADRSVPVLRIDAPDGTPRAVVFSAGSHNTTLTGGNMRIGGDYAGFAQKFIESRKPGVQAMFMTGCAGDANPYPRGTWDLARRHGSELADEVVRVLEGNLEPVRGPLKTEFRVVNLPLEKMTRAEIEKMAEGASSYREFFTTGALEKLNKGGALLESYPAPFALWQFGDDLTLVALSGETLVDFALDSEKVLGPLGLWVTGYNNEVYGYLPPARVLQEGGYETRGLYSDYGLFRPEVEQVVMKAIEEMARKAGRKMP